MKLFSVKVFVASVAIFLLAAPSVTFAQSTGWVLYDNFNSGKIDPTKLDIDNSSAAISVENGLLKFVHDAKKPNDSSWLIFKKSPAKIKAVKAKVKIRNDAPGDLRARIGGYLGKTEDNYPVWLSITLRNDYDRVEASATAFTDTTSTGQWKYDLFYSQVGKPDGLIGNWYVLEIYFDRSRLLFKGDAVKQILHQLTEPVYPLTSDIPDWNFKGIGTRNGIAATSKFTVYFDNVYVLY